MAMKRLKLANLNVAIKLSNSEAVVELLKQQNADIVTLQELVRHLEDDVGVTYRSKHDIERLLSPMYPHSFFAPVWVANGFKTPGKVDYDFGGHIEQGSELMSKYPINSGTNEFFYKHFEYMQDWSRWRKEDHGRSLMVTELEIDGAPLRVLNLHGIWTADKRGDERTIKECEYLVAAAMRSDVATIITGDFNLLPDTESIEILDKSFRNLIKEFGITSTRPTFKDELEDGDAVVDYVFVNDLVEVHDFKTINTNVSDHLPLVLDFSILS